MKNAPTPGERIYRRMQANKMDMFNYPGSPKNILWYLNHRYLYNTLGIHRLEVWDELSRKYVNDPRQLHLDTNEKKTSAKGNLSNQIWTQTETMSMETFIKAAMLAEISVIRFNVEWELKDGKKCRGGVTFPLQYDIMVTEDDQKSMSEKEELLSEVSNLLDDPDKTHLKEKLVSLINESKNSGG